MADIANQLQGAVEGLDRFLEALDNSSMKLGSNAAIESKLARAAQKKADQDLRFRKKIEKMEKETAKREAAHLAQLKAMEPFRKKAFTALKQELKAKVEYLERRESELVSELENNKLELSEKSQLIDQATNKIEELLGSIDIDG